ncbi:MAG: hypothetical protein JO327_02200 [Nitrososphaeraceae archaeon]|nr:hypothetical protein [Nitrososphaeraceae archaeon]MBV9666923.1 hypothetical protein [Nitrososphaeraceae archaeon]
MSLLGVCIRKVHVHHHPLSPLVIRGTWKMILQAVKNILIGSVALTSDNSI